MAAPGRGARYRTAYQTPIAATTSPTCSFVAIAAAAQSANGSSRRRSRNHQAKSSSGHAERDGVEVAGGQPLHRRVEQVRERQRRRRPVGVEVRPREPEDGKRSRGDRPGLDDEQRAPGSARATRAARASARIGSKCEPSREICSPWTSVTESTSPFAVDQTACVMLPRSKRPLPNARWRRTASALKTDGERGGREPDEPRRRHRATSCSTSPRHRSPSTASLACSR